MPKVATGFVADILCTETFVSGQQPHRIFRETTAAMPGVSLITWALDYQRRSRAQGRHRDVLGFGRSHAVYREGLGCYLDHGDAVADISVPSDRCKASQALFPDIAGPRWWRRPSATGRRA